jgi:hypothetical protein
MRGITASIIDRKRIAAVSTLEALGFNFDAGQWQPPEAAPALPQDGDAILALLHQRAEALAGCCEASGEDSEPKAVADAIEAYERARWPEGKVPGGNG